MKKTEIILKEGYPFIFVTGGIFILSLLFRFDTFWQIFWFVITFFMVYFFSNPERIPDESGEDVIISPADGEIIEIVETKEKFFTNQDMIKISIRLNNSIEPSLIPYKLLTKTPNPIFFINSPPIFGVRNIFIFI